MMQKHVAVASSLVLAASLFLGGACSLAEEPETTAQIAEMADATASPRQEDALAALRSMSSYLRSLSSFEVSSTFYRDDVLVTGQKILVGGTSSFLVRFPDKLFARVLIDERQKDFEIYYDGHSLTLYGKNKNFYATSPAPATLQELVSGTFAERGIELPLQDLFLWGTDLDDESAITGAVVIADTTLQGKNCTHYAFRQEGVDWQIWIQSGDTPLPLQLVITTTSDAAQPQYSAALHWLLAPEITDGDFIFTPPEGARVIDFRPPVVEQGEERAADGNSSAKSE